jgi:ribosomal protein S18 acetylase RimI-like enzyme
MKLVRWKRFTWDLTKLSPLANPLPANFAFREAPREDAKVVINTVMTSFMLDSAWSDVLNLFRDRLEMQLDLAFQRESLPAIVITHGVRIIAASVISTEIDGESNLISGPCVLSEYGNRGLGTALLLQSLRMLRKAGLDRAAAITKESVTACKFVYPKFGSTNQAHDYEPQLIGI